MLQVDKHIRKLDADLARFEADLKDKHIQQPNTEEKTETVGKKGRSQTHTTTQHRGENRDSWEER